MEHQENLKVQVLDGSVFDIATKTDKSNYINNIYIHLEDYRLFHSDFE